MGIAPYGSTTRAAPIVRELMDRFEWPSFSPLCWKRLDQFEPTYLWGSWLQSVFKFKRFDDIGLAMQIFIESMTLKWIENIYNETKLTRYVLGGGLFMNVKLNKLILELPFVDELFIMPSCSDESNSIGAAFAASTNGESTSKNEEFFKLKHLYLGPQYSKSELTESVAHFLEENPDVVLVESKDIENDVADLLANGEIVARYAEREEFGARALGNRSILADPGEPQNIIKINKMIKQRDFWMPFAGSMTAEQCKLNITNPKNHDPAFMITTFDTRTEPLDFRAATHAYDETIRPQKVTAESNPRYYRLLTRFAEISGKRGGLLNTSFNLHGFPIVSSPSDALLVFKRSGLKNLALENFLLRKR